ncbi:MAG TPA: ATP-binding protein [Candidatus Cloacimonadota bacterium]|nr:ATP-binding protein [Candidatus Cloacimonadota bacterium]HPK41200.1 ATP-binding protein [Candidatus Cloacimonadota bacterium]
MKIAILSGKGGTGKTLVSVNLAKALDTAHYIDCDIEEPNGHLFFKPLIDKKHDISVKKPLVDHDKCTACRKCVEVCRFNALALIGGKIKVFDDICHSCGACSILCPEKAITEIDKVIGYVQEGMADNVKASSGFMNVGVANGIPLIKSLLKNASKDLDVVIDCPPGSACSVMESIQEADYCVLVAEPSIFGAHNLEMVYDLVKLFNKKHGVVLNKSLTGDNPSAELCHKHQIPIIGDIPFEKRIAEMNSNGDIIIDKDDHYKQLFYEILLKIKEEVQL